MAPDPALTLRCITLNFWGTEPPLDRRIDLAVRQLRALAPDVICMQEVRPLDGVAGRTTADVIADQLDMYAHYAKACEWQAGDAGMAKAGQEGLAIISRAPLEDSRALALPEPRLADTRMLLSGRVATA
ncbi:MAG TPA: endonuclease/exonuclease/phosphatase family protein, partial [Kofleriaceae bacterium]